MEPQPTKERYSFVVKITHKKRHLRFFKGDLSKINFQADPRFNNCYFLGHQIISFPVKFPVRLHNTLIVLSGTYPFLSIEPEKPTEVYDEWSHIEPDPKKSIDIKVNYRPLIRDDYKPLFRSKASIKREKDKIELFERDGNKCLKCGSDKNLTIDHVEPKSKGGKNNISNYQTLCGTCNQEKRDKKKDYR